MANTDSCRNSSPSSSSPSGSGEHPPHSPTHRRTKGALPEGRLVHQIRPAEIAAWLDGARHPERSTAGDRTHLAVSFSRSASRIREIACSIRVVGPIALGQETFRWLLRI